nr:MAG TPA: hypothetical protein [Caudoviricetes sp.]
MNMNEIIKANGYELEKVEETTEKAVYMLTIPNGSAVKGADCVTRTTLPACYASYDWYEVAIENGAPVVVTHSNCAIVSTPDPVKAKAELERVHKATVVVHSVDRAQGETLGIPKVIFNEIATHAERPASQTKEKETAKTE